MTAALTPAFLLQILTVVGALGGSYGLMSGELSGVRTNVAMNLSRIEVLSDMVSLNREHIVRLQEQVIVLKDQVLELRRQAGLREVR